MAAPLFNLSPLGPISSMFFSQPFVELMSFRFCSNGSILWKILVFLFFAVFFF